jgi:glycogen operon protein
MTETEWRQSTLRAFGFRLCGDAMDEVDERGQPITGDTLLVLLNADAKPVPFVLPDAHPGDAWERLIDTAVAPPPATPPRFAMAARLSLEDRSLQLLRACRRD